MHFFLKKNFLFTPANIWMKGYTVPHGKKYMTVFKAWNKSIYVCKNRSSISAGYNLLVVSFSHSIPFSVTIKVAILRSSHGQKTISNFRSLYTTAVFFLVSDFLSVELCILGWGGRACWALMVRFVRLSNSLVVMRFDHESPSAGVMSPVISYKFLDWTVAATWKINRTIFCYYTGLHFINLKINLMFYQYTTKYRWIINKYIM